MLRKVLGQLWFALPCLCVFARAAPAGTAVPDPSKPRELVVGMSGPLSGPSSALGQGMRDGIEAYFARVNQAGGIFGAKLRLMPIDDGYEPAQAARNVHRLLDREKVFAMLGDPGTPTAAVVLPITNLGHVPFFGAYTGAGLLRKDPPDRYVINYRASYAQETAEMVRGLLGGAKLKPQDLAFLSQNDAYGESGYNGAIAALHAIGFNETDQLIHGRYPRNTEDVEGALAQVLDPSVHPRAIIMIGTTGPCAKFIRLARQHGLDAIFVIVSFVNGDALLAALGADAEGVVVTQVVPPLDSDLPALKLFRESVPEEKRSFVSLEGFIVAGAFSEGLRRAGPMPTADTFIDALESGGAFDLGVGQEMRLSKIDHQLSNHVWLTIVRAGRFTTLQSWADVRRGGAR